MNEIFNPAPTAPVSVNSDAFNRKRYSNYLPTYKELQEKYGTTGTSLGKDSSGSGTFNWGFVGDWLNSASNAITGIWGTSDRYVANAYQTMYNQERKNTNLLIGIVVALLLLAFAFLIIKKK